MKWDGEFEPRLRNVYGNVKKWNDAFNVMTFVEIAGEGAIEPSKNHVLVTKKCHRKCPFLHNHSFQIASRAPVVKLAEKLKGHEAVA